MIIRGGYWLVHFSGGWRKQGVTTLSRRNVFIEVRAGETRGASPVANRGTLSASSTDVQCPRLVPEDAAEVDRESARLSRARRRGQCVRLVGLGGKEAEAEREVLCALACASPAW